MVNSAKLIGADFKSNFNGRIVQSPDRIIGTKGWRCAEVSGQRRRAVTPTPDEITQHARWNYIDALVSLCGPEGRGAAFMMIEGRIICVLRADSSGRATAPSYWGGMTETRSLVPGGEFPSRYAFKAESEAEGKCREGGEWKSERSGR